MLTPTRELAIQVAKDFKDIIKRLAITCFYGGSSYNPQSKSKHKHLLKRRDSEIIPILQRIHVFPLASFFSVVSLCCFNNILYTLLSVMTLSTPFLLSSGCYP